MQFKCPNCQKPLKVKDELAGKKAKCPGCGKGLVVPVSPARGAQDPGACPSCGAAMAQEAVFCIQCGFDKRSGEKLQTTIGTEPEPEEEPQEGE